MASERDLDEADWLLPQRFTDALQGLGLPDMTPDTPLSALSGGQQTRAALAALIFHKPDLILLDEPTNNLDRAGRLAVADLLTAWRGAAVVVSHDRELLQSLDMIAELSPTGFGFTAATGIFIREEGRGARDGDTRSRHSAARGQAGRTQGSGRSRKTGSQRRARPQVAR